MLFKERSTGSWLTLVRNAEMDPFDLDGLSPERVAARFIEERGDLIHSRLDVVGAYDEVKFQVVGYRYATALEAQKYQGRLSHGGPCMVG